MVIIESKRKKRENILKSYPEAVIIDVTSKAEDDFVRLSPFYPHGGIPVPYSNGVTAVCVEGIWQGLKVFEQEDIDTSMFANSTMKNIKRSVRTHGRVLGHRKGVNSPEILGYAEAKHSIYIPAYKWTLEHKTQDLVEKIRQLSSKGVVVFLDRKPEQILQNIEGDARPLLAADKQRIFKLYEERIELYRKYADKIVTNTGEFGRTLASREGYARKIAEKG